jgi:hypothetical protein
VEKTGAEVTEAQKADLTDRPEAKVIDTEKPAAERGQEGNYAPDTHIGHCPLSHVC